MSWVLPAGSTFERGIYGADNPWELSAELCAGYLMKKLGKTLPGDTYHYFERFLTDEVIAWLERYIFVLPESRIDVLTSSDEAPSPEAEVTEAGEDNTEPQVEAAESAGLFLSGLVLNSDGQPDPGVFVKACGHHLCHYSTTDADGAFSRRLEEGEYWLGVEVPDEDGAGVLVGYYAAEAPGNFASDRDAATIIRFSEDFPELTITLPAAPDVNSTTSTERPCVYHRLHSTPTGFESTCVSPLPTRPP